MEQQTAPVKVSITNDKLKAWVSAPDGVAALDVEALSRTLQAAGVVSGINRETLASFAAAPKAEAVLVAEGLPPQPGVDETVEWLVKTEAHEQEETGAGRETARVDFRDTSTIISVEKDALLAVKHPSRPGTPGTAVTGEPLPPPEPRLIELRAGKNVAVNAEGNRAVALVNGRPWYKQTGNLFTVHVDPLLVQKGDVSIKTGHIRFKGDVKILGSVGEAMEVQASGNVEITGLLTRATVISGGRLVVHRGVISSRLKAGRTFPGARKLTFVLGDIQAALEQVSRAMEQLQRNRDFKQINFGRLLMTLLDARFKNLRPLVKNALRQIAQAKGDVPEEVVRCAKSLNHLVGLNPLTVKSFSELTQNVAETAQMLQEEAAAPADVIIHSAMASTVQSSGNVTVTSQGCVNTTINAGGNVRIKGAFKGGEIFCEGNAEVQELGSALGVPPVVRVGAGGLIRVNRAFAGAVIQAGQRRHTLTQETGSFKARLNKEGELELI
ncbi:DUF342 domain-containing protein [Desulfotomaculum copahuensis]|uniref:Flagellar Assembly Protein A N-terminal region domain-containing protein n=1 Tax=Desulfotomaculum copahuensis TaxID=1838280 RepID=A0A1B7LIJ6_9FIRM|nr:FapA family protein [Desulfotomaculum copahuensis]OAT86395.1 hypothetical protein A6M21_02915 [Desulfotomaculum copahuensis]